MLAETMGSRALHEAAQCRSVLTDGAAMICAFHQIVSQSPNTRLPLQLIGTCNQHSVYICSHLALALAVQRHCIGYAVEGIGLGLQSTAKYSQNPQL